MSELFRLNGIPVSDFSAYKKAVQTEINNAEALDIGYYPCVYITHASGRNYLVSSVYTPNAIADDCDDVVMRRNYNHLKKRANKYCTCM